MLKEILQIAAIGCLFAWCLSPRQVTDGLAFDLLNETKPVVVGFPDRWEPAGTR